MLKEYLNEKLNNWQSSSLRYLPEMAEKYKYISFDIFDTLLKRDVPKPSDVFALMESELKISDYKRKRIEAERKARNATATHEVTLEQIYSNYDGDNIERLKEKEIIFEIALSAINLDMIEIYYECLKKTQVVLTTDMYLPREIIEALLRKHKIDGYVRLFISNEEDKMKVDGKLFKYICQELKINKRDILHVGNAFRADWLMPRIMRINSMKVATYRNRLQRKYQYKRCTFKQSCLDFFLNNHTCSYKAENFETNLYYAFGYESLGPLLYGFVTWVHNECMNAGIEQVLFLARDGFIMKKLYDRLGYNKDIPSNYLEVSRRSLRVPSFSSAKSYKDMVSELSVPNITNITQILDSFGLAAENYRKIIEENGILFDEQIKRERLTENRKFHRVYDLLRDDILKNADIERENFLGYIRQFDFSKKTALVDIGWAGTMQKYICDMLDSVGISHDISGYYVGMTRKSRKILSGKRAKGYAFDCFNNENDVEMESSYIGLIESMFLEQDGSVKCYCKNKKQYSAVRYPYEYKNQKQVTKEAVCVKQIQNAALDFAMDFSSSILSSFIGCNSSVMYSHIHTAGCRPSLLEIRMFGDFEFFNCGERVFLAKPNKFFYYLFHSEKLRKDLFDCQWKIGFLKALLKLNLPYEKLYEFLRKEANK